MEWTDATTYSRENKERKPTMLGLKLKKANILVIWDHRELPGQWCMTCNDLGMRAISLPYKKYEDLEVAETTALILVKEKALSIVQELTKLGI